MGCEKRGSAYHFACAHHLTSLALAPSSVEKGYCFSCHLVL